MNTQTPSLGRVVHFVMPDSTHRSARVSKVDGESTFLHVDLLPGDDSLLLSVDEFIPMVYLMNLPPSTCYLKCQQDEENKSPLTWHWPEFVPAKETK